MTGILIAAIIIGLIIIVGGFALFLLLPILLALIGTLALVVVMAIVAILMVPNFVTLDTFKPEIINALKQATGREIAIGGPIGFTVWPVLGLELRDISIGNPAGSSDPIMMAAQQLGVGVTLSSLLEHRLELRELRIVGGQFNLATDEHGKGNWVFKSSAASTHSEEVNETKQEEAAEADKGGEDPFSIKDVQIEKIEVVDTNVSYDTAEGEPVDLDDIDMVFSMPSLDRELTLKGDLTLREREVKVEGTIGQLRAIMDKGATPIAMTLSLGGDQLKLDGTLHGTDFKGNMQANVANLSQLASWAGGKPAVLPLTALSAAAHVDANSNRADLTGLNLKLDDIVVSGTANANWSGARPRVVADVDVNALNLDKLMPASAAASASAPAGGATSSAAPDLSALDSVNAEITARLAGLTAKGVELGSTTAKVNLNNGRLQFSNSPANLFGGSIAVKADVSAAGRGGRTFTANTILDGVNMGAALMQFAGSDRLDGKGDLTLNLSGPIASTEVMKRELGGDGRFIFRDGAIKGVNIPALIRNAKSLLSRQAAATERGPVQTDFTELSGTFRINNGVVSNSDLKMLSPLVRVAGRGMASLPANNVDYRIEASLVADLTGQGGSLDRKGLVIPINVRGPFSALRYEPDLQGLVLGNLDAAKDVGAAIQNLGTKEGQRDTRDAIKGLLGLPTRQRPAAPVPAPVVAPAPVAPVVAAPPAVVVPAVEAPAPAPVVEAPVAAPVEVAPVAPAETPAETPPVASEPAPAEEAVTP